MDVCKEGRVKPTIVINATSIGAKPDGIGAYGVHLIHALAAADCGLQFKIFLNRDAKTRFEGFPATDDVAFGWVSPRVSPDRGSKGHIARWAFAQSLALRYRATPVFSLSQLEATGVGGPSIVTVHDVIPLLYPEHHPRQHPYYKRFLGPALRRASAVVTPSQTTALQLEQHYSLDPGLIHVIPHGPTVPRRSETSRVATTRPFILCLAPPSPTKNLQALIAAFGLIKDRIGEDLVIAGADIERGLSAWPGIEKDVADRVQLRSNISDQEKIALLDQASALVCPSLDEGFGLPTLEAMNRGCPVVASHAGSLPEVCGGAAALVDPTDILAMAATLARVVIDERLRRSLIARGTERARAFSWRRSARRHIEVLRFALDMAPRGAGA